MFHKYSPSSVGSVAVGIDILWTPDCTIWQKSFTFTRLPAQVLKYLQTSCSTMSVTVRKSEDNARIQGLDKTYQDSEASKLISFRPTVLLLSTFPPNSSTPLPKAYWKYSVQIFRWPILLEQVQSYFQVVFSICATE